MSAHEPTLRNAQSLVEQVSPEFSELTADIQEVIQASDNTTVIAVLLFKLAQERQKTNALMEKLYDQYDELSFRLKTRENHESLPNPTNTYAVLAEADQSIMKLVEEKKQVDAQMVKERLGYKNPNAASQRLNQLVKANLLTKVQAGRKVVFHKK